MGPKSLLYVLIASTFMVLSSCNEINTTNTEEAFENWLGVKSGAEVEVLQAKYWQSAHFTKEYIVFLKIKPSDEWWLQFVEQNGLMLDTSQWYVPSKKPDWFTPPNTSKVYGFGEEYNNSRYFQDSLSGVCYIYEIQL
jgi:hypothetical protein